MATVDESTTNWSTWYLATDAGKALVEFTTCLSVSISMDGEVVQEPVEKGSFASYNKTIAPISVNAVMVKQGTATELSETLETIRGLHTGTTLFSFLTPEREYRSLTLETFDFERKREEGLNLLTVNLQMKEIKQTSISYSSVKIPAESTKDPSAADTKSGGQKNATKVSSARNTAGIVIEGSDENNRRSSNNDD